MGRISDSKQAATQQRKQEFLGGGRLRDVFDVLGAGAFGAAGGFGAARKEAERRAGEGISALPAIGKEFISGIVPGIKQRKSFIDVLREAKTKEGTPVLKGKKTTAGLGFAADVVLDPTNLVALGLGKISRVTGAGAKVKSIIKESKVGKFLGRKFIPGFEQPEKFINLTLKLQRELEKGGEVATDIGKSLSQKLSKGEQQRLGQIIRGGITTNDRLQQLAQPAIDELAKLGKESVKLGLLDESAFKANFKRYMPRLFRHYEKEGGVVKNFITGTKPKRLLLQRFKQRKNVPAEIRQELGEILEPAFPVAKGISQLTHDVATFKFFDDVAKDFASDVAQEGFTQLPKVQKLGKLSGKFVPDSMADNLNELVKTKSNAAKVYSKALGWWKIGKTVLNPSYHARNMMSNFILNDLGGLSPARLDIYTTAMRDLAKKGDTYTEAKNAGLFGTEFYTNEIKGLLDVWEKAPGSVFGKVGNLAKHMARLGGKAQAFTEDWHKLAHFTYRRMAGDSVDDAARSAKKFLFDYQAVTPFEQSLRGLVPFYTFQRKAAPLILETAVTKPKKISKFGKAQLTAERELTDPSDLDRQRENKPEWMKKGVFIKLPGKDKFGRDKFFDLTYILPFGDFAEFDRLALAGRITPAITVPMQVLTNRNFFFDKPLWDETDTGAEKSKKILNFMGQSFLPNVAPGSYSWNKVAKAVKQEPDYLGRTRDLWVVLADVLAGLKMTPIDFNREFKKAQFKKRTLKQEIQGKLKFERRRKDINSEKKKENIKKLQLKLKRLN